MALPQVGALVEGPAFHPYLSGRSNLARLDAADSWTTPAPRAPADRRRARPGRPARGRPKRYRAYSLGMRQRLAIAAALLQPRELLVLDEPTNGLDPQGTREVRHLVASLAEDGATVLISSHLLSEVEQICSHLGIMSDGRLVAQGTVASCAGRSHDGRRHDGAAVGRRVGARPARESPTSRSVGDEVRGHPATARPRRSAAALVHAGVPVRGFAVTTPSLEDLFVDLTGEGFDVSG